MSHIKKQNPKDSTSEYKYTNTKIQISEQEKRGKELTTPVGEKVVMVNFLSLW